MSRPRSGPTTVHHPGEVISIFIFSLRSVSLPPGLVLLSLAGLFGLTAGCASADVTTSGGFSPAEYGTIAVGEFSVGSAAYGQREEVAQTVANTFQRQLPMLGYQVVERSRLEQLLDEQGLQWSEATSDRGRAEIGELLNVEALLVGNVPRYKRTGGNDYEVVVFAKLVDVSTGEVVWTGSAKTGEGFADLGDVTEAVDAIREDTTDMTSGIRNVESELNLEQSMVEHTQELVEKICEAFPQY